MVQKVMIVNARLRPRQDKDLIAAIDRLDRGELSDYVREGLRAILCRRTLPSSSPSVRTLIAETDYLQIPVEDSLNDLLARY